MKKQLIPSTGSQHPCDFFFLITRQQNYFDTKREEKTTRQATKTAVASASLLYTSSTKTELF